MDGWDVLNDVNNEMISEFNKEGEDLLLIHGILKQGIKRNSLNSSIHLSHRIAS